MKRLCALLLPCAVWFASTAHVGSPDVWYSGYAGPYAVRVQVRPPQVVPGLADVIMRVRGANRITVAPARSDTGDEGQPPPDVATRDSEDHDRFTAKIWLMARGAYRIVIRIDGAQGTASLIVPVNATATALRPMSTATTWGLLAIAAFLFAGLVSIVGAAVRESVLPAGVAVSAERQQRARLAMAAGALVMLLVLFGGWRWWSAVDEWHRARLERPWSVTSTVDSNATLRFAITDSIWLQRGIPRSEGYRYHTAPVIPDHGKLMHMFLVRDDQQAFAHIHPASSDQDNYTAQLPALPAGTYRLYADIVHENGFAQTLTDTLQIPPTPARAASTDIDDTRWQADDRLDGPTLWWIGPKEVMSGQAVELGVDVVGANGLPVQVQPYMGMAGHAAVERNDGRVFVHLHPLGTISMAAQQAVVAKSRSARLAHTMPTATGNRVTFPYAFPEPGQYRVWIQVRIAQGVVTSAFDVTVN
ncbi:MAG TPA: hypothetical protein VGD49_05810 [Longimicrobiales bacterium]